MINRTDSLEESFSWIARSVVLICGGAFLIVCGQLLLKWHLHLGSLGEVKELSFVQQSAYRLDDSYWKEYFSTYLEPGKMLHANDLKSLNAELLATGYFAHLALDLSGSILQISYELQPPLALLAYSESPFALYKGEHLLPYLKIEPPLTLNCQLILPLALLWDSLTELSESENAEMRLKNDRALKLASSILMALQPPLLQRWHCNELSMEGYLGLEHPASEVVLSFLPLPDPFTKSLSSIDFEEASLPLKVRLGGSILQHPQRLSQHKLEQLLLAAQKGDFCWIDARGEDFVSMGRNLRAE